MGGRLVASFVAGAGGGVVGAVGGEDAFEDVDGVGDVVGVGDDADEVLVVSAGDGDVEPTTGGGWCGEGDGGGGGVGLVAEFGGGVARVARVCGHVVGGEGDGAVSVDAGHGQPTISGDRIDGPVVAVADRVARSGAEQALIAARCDHIADVEAGVADLDVGCRVGRRRAGGLAQPG